MKLTKLKIKVLLLGLITCFPSASFADEVVNVYSSRIENLIKPAFSAFTEETGIKVRFSTGKEAALLERLKAEGKHTPADILITVDAGNLWLASQAGVLQSVQSSVLDSQLPQSLRDPEGYWFGLTVRARTIAYSRERVNPSELSTYAALGEAKWKGRLCLRTSKKVYNKSLVASMIKSLGMSGAEDVVRGWMNNKPFIEAKDSGVLKAIKAGKCDVGVVNTYYLGRELAKNSNFPVGLFWADQEGRGTHVNISGAGVTKHAKNKKNAVRLIEFLSSAKAQNLFADGNMEYPANQNVSPSSKLIEWWGSSFKADQVNIAEAGKNQKDAVMLMNRLGYK